MFEYRNISNFLLFVVTIFLLSNAEIAKAQESILSESDKKQIIISLINRTNFEKFDIDEYTYFSTKYLPQSIIDNFPEVEGVKFKLLSPKEIEEKLKTGLTHREIISLKKKGNKVLISIIKDVAGDSYSRTSGAQFEYRKIKGKWKGKIKSFILGIT